MPKKEPKKVSPKGQADSKASSSAELSEEQLERVAGGASDIFAKLGDIKGESTDDKHKDEIELMPSNPFKPVFKR